jgi:hypothetical protein
MADPNNLENQVQLLMAQVAALQAQPQVQAPVQAPNPVGPLALTPVQANQDVIDLMQSNGIKLYEAITTPLETKFNGSSAKLLAFLDNIKQKALRYGWTDHLLSISNQDPVNLQNRNLVQQHRMLSIENVQNHAAAYIGTQTRLAQDASMMYELLRDSLTEGARGRLATESAKYTINGIRDGPSYLKTLLTKFYVETKATNFHIRPFASVRSSSASLPKLWNSSTTSPLSTIKLWSSSRTSQEAVKRRMTLSITFSRLISR